MTFSVVCAEAMASKEAALVLDCGDEAQQVQERKNEGAKNLPTGTVVIKPPGTAVFLSVCPLRQSIWTVDRFFFCMNRPIWPISTNFWVL